MQNQRNLNISFKNDDLGLLQELKRRSALTDYCSTSGITIHLIKQGLIYEKRNNRAETLLPL